MNILIVATHPNIEESIINKTWLKALKKEENIKVRFLDELYPNKTINVKKEQECLLKADRVIFQFPFRWFNMPSLMRDYFDSVFEFGWAYGPHGNALKGKEFLVAVSTGAPEYSYQGGSYNNFTITELLRHHEATANALQMTYLPYYALFDTPRLTEEEILCSVTKYLEHINNEDLNHKKVLERLKKLNKHSSFIDL